MAFKFANEIIDEIKTRGSVEVLDRSVSREEFEEWFCTEREKQMTREEVIQILKILKEDYWDDDGYGHETKKYNDTMLALDMAIKALEQEPRPMEKFESVKDHISKLAGDYKCWDNRLTWDEALELYRILEQEPCEDCVSRQYIIEKLNEMNGTAESDRLFEIVENAPSVTPTRKKGKWIPISERLPEDFQRVLVTIVNYNGYKVVRVAEYRRRTFKIKENYEQWNVGDKGLLAWMPMVEPYEEMESAEDA